MQFRTEYFSWIKHSAAIFSWSLFQVCQTLSEFILGLLALCSFIWRFSYLDQASRHCHSRKRSNWGDKIRWYSMQTTQKNCFISFQTCAKNNESHRNTRWDDGNKRSRCLGWAKTAKRHLLVEVQINSSSVMMRMMMINSSSMVAEGPNFAK